MTTSSATTLTGSTYRFGGWAAIASGVFGIIAFWTLIAYLTTTPTEILESKVVLEPGVMPPMARLLLTSNSVGVMLQALFMIPVAFALHDFGRQRSPGVSRAAVTVGIIALCGVALLELLPLVNPEVSDILFMGPMGFVGVWLIVVNCLVAGVLSKTLRIVGIVVGVGWVIEGASFFFLGGLAVLTNGPQAYADDVDFHNGIAIGGVPGNLLYPIWAILLGRKLLRGVGLLR
jgi:hypothetical protein